MTLTPPKIATIAEKTIAEWDAMPTPGMSNYKEVLAQTKRVIHDALVMIRDLARAIPPPGDASP